MHPMLNNPEKPLSEREESLLAELEAVIETNMKGFVLVGMALAQINEQRLYRVQYPTFEEYLLKVWDMARRTGYQLIEAAAVHENLKQLVEDVNNCGQEDDVRNCAQTEIILPKNEAQARPLTLFEAEEQREIWLAVLDKANASGTKITANFIIQIILERQRKAIDERVKKHADRTKKDGKTLPTLVQSTYMALLQVVQNQNDEDWKSIGRSTMVSLLEDLLETLKA